MRRRLLLPGLLLATSLAAPTLAGPRDGDAKKSIDEAINKHYIAAKYDRAESLLVAAISACKGQCSAPVVAKAWMYVGIVRGGKNDQKGAKEAFGNALATDPKVALDDVIATPETQKTFAAAKRSKKGGPAPSAVDVAPTGEDTGGGGGNLDCNPKLSEVQVRHPIPVWCTADEKAKLELKYKSASGEWKSEKMKKRRGSFQATIPCDAVQKKGTVRFYVRARDENGDPAGTFGKKNDPVKIRIVRESEEEPPAFPDKEPPKRCPRSSGEGAESDADADSDSGSGAACEVSDDCETGESCEDGTCRGKKKKNKAEGKARSAWFGLHYAHDFALTSGSEVCSRDSQKSEGFACFYQDSETQYEFVPHPKYSNDIKGGLAPATFRALISFDYLLGQNITTGVRVGYAFGGGPPSGAKKEAKFLPFHAEVRASYWFGDAPFASSGFRPYVGLGGGAAQVDAKLPVTVGDCAGTPGGPPSSPSDDFPKDTAYYLDCRQGSAKPVPLQLDVYKRLGQGFIGLHGGLMYAVAVEHGVKLEVGVMQMLPTSGQVIEPSLGYVFGF
ncbi:MAG: hypothetical protein HYZ29_34635 [Myxococcales bacterium]|nr:hypothetical protein [Myxococcales bacterium]